VIGKWRGREEGGGEEIKGVGRNVDKRVGAAERAGVECMARGGARGREGMGWLMLAFKS